MSSGEEVVRIAGAGPAGLACAITLAAAGRAVEVHERRVEVGGRFDGDHQILPAFGESPQALELLDMLGIAPGDLECVPLHDARFVELDGGVHPARSRLPYAYLVRRGPAEGTLDHALAERARELGVRLLPGRALARERATVLATGPAGVDGLALERMFRTGAADRADVLLDSGLAPGGYAYLFVRGGEATLGIAALGAFDDLDRRLEVARGRLQEVEPFDERRARSAAHPMNFRMPRSALDAGRPRVGEAAGFQDFLFGLGLRMALLSGRLAALALLDGSDYDALWRQALGRRMRTSLVDRWLYERAWIRRQILARVAREDLREILQDLQRDRWIKDLLLPFVQWRRLRTGEDGHRIPRRTREGRG